MGSHPLRLYSRATPNGSKVTVMPEELLALGHLGAEYDALLIRIHEGSQFSNCFVAGNPNLGGTLIPPRTLNHRCPSTRSYHFWQRWNYPMCPS